MTDKKFYQLSLEERLNALSLSEEERTILENSSLATEIAQNLIENQISSIEIPLGICFISIDGSDYHVPMATEEASVIAAANNGAKIAGNFRTLKNERFMSGQIIFYEVTDFDQLSQKIEKLQKEIFLTAELAYPSIYKRQGGLIDFNLEKQESFCSVNFKFDSKDAMGANMINTMLEAISQLFKSKLPEEKILFSILTNKNPDCQTIVETRIPLEKIGLELAEKIAIASNYAQIDPTRAATHNKGIMNGIEAIALATGNDNRGLNASIYAFSNQKGLAKWEIQGQELVGKITVSLPVASAGGATQILPKAKVSHNLLKNPTAKELATIMASVGLANNLAALKALVTKGIQAGHLNLHMRNLALSVGAKGEEVERLAELLNQSSQKNKEKAEKLLNFLREHSL
ncbi:MAG: 3-hydroxy-3-methylglutaryl-CoA reductase [Lactovum sp.]